MGCICVCFYWYAHKHILCHIMPEAVRHLKLGIYDISIAINKSIVTSKSDVVFVRKWWRNFKDRMCPAGEYIDYIHANLILLSLSFSKWYFSHMPSGFKASFFLIFTAVSICLVKDLWDPDYNHPKKKTCMAQVTCNNN